MDERKNTIARIDKDYIAVLFAQLLDRKRSILLNARKTDKRHSSACFRGSTRSFSEQFYQCIYGNIFYAKLKAHVIFSFVWAA